MTIDIQLCRDALKADGDDDALILRYLASARSIAEGLCNRKFYDDQASLDADVALAAQDMQAAIDLKRTEMEAVPQGQTWRYGMLTDRYAGVFAAIGRRLHGCVIDSAIEAAILFLLGHLYMNRQEVTVLTATPTQMPMAAQRILQPYLWIGNLGEPDADHWR